MQAESRRYRRHPTIPAGTDPSELFPPGEVDPLTAPLLARSRMVRPLSWLALFRPAGPAEASPLSRSRPHLRGFPAGSPLPTPRVAALHRPDAPLGFASTLGFHPSIPSAVVSGRSCSPSCSVHGRSRHLQPQHPPKRMLGTDDTVALGPFVRARMGAVRQSHHRADAGPRDRARSRRARPTMPKHRIGAEAFQVRPLPAHP